MKQGRQDAALRQPQVSQVSIAYSDGNKRRAVAAVLLHENVLRTRLFHVGEDLGPFNPALPDWGKRIDATTGEFIRIYGDVLLHILDVQQGEAARKAPEIVQRILSGISDPEDVHFHLDYRGVTFGQQNLVAVGVAVPLKFADVIVICLLRDQSNYPLRRLPIQPGWLEKNRAV